MFIPRPIQFSHLSRNSLALVALITASCDFSSDEDSFGDSGATAQCNQLSTVLAGSWQSVDGNTGTGWRFPGQFTLGEGGLFTSGSLILTWSAAFSPPDEVCDAFMLVDGADNLIITYGIEYLSEGYLQIQNWSRSERYQRVDSSGNGASDMVSIQLDIERNDIWANGHEPLRLRATLTHRDLGPLEGFPLEFATDSDAPSEFWPLFPMTDANGVAVVDIETEQMGAIQVSASVEFDPSIIDTRTLAGVRRRTIAFVQGINTELNSVGEPIWKELRDAMQTAGFERPTRGEAEAEHLWNNGFDDDFDGFEDDGGPMIIDYSYLGGEFGQFTGLWEPYDYVQGNTSQPLATSVQRLHELMDRYGQSNPNSGLVVMGHSQGGFLTLHALDIVVESGSSSTVLDAIVTMDGALGGAPPDWTTWIVTQLTPWGLGQAPYDLQNLWETASNHSQQGTYAQWQEGALSLTNAELVEQAHTLGVRTLTIGNDLDGVWNPLMCQLPFSTDNTSTQTIITSVSEWETYSLFTLGQLTTLLCVTETHSQVLKDSLVHSRILQFLAQLP